MKPFLASKALKHTLISLPSNCWAWNCSQMWFQSS